MSNQSVSITNAALASSYTITVNISDRITTKTLTFTLNKATPILSMLNTNRVGINKMDPVCELDVNGDAKVSGYGQFENGIRGKQFSSMGTGYLNAFSISASGIVVFNQYMQFDIIQKNRIGHVELLLGYDLVNNKIVVNKATVAGTSKVFYSLTDTTFTFYIEKAQSSDCIEIVNFEKGL